MLRSRGRMGSRQLPLPVTASLTPDSGPASTPALVPSSRDDNNKNVTPAIERHPGPPSRDGVQWRHDDAAVAIVSGVTDRRPSRGAKVAIHGQMGPGSGAGTTTRTNVTPAIERHLGPPSRDGVQWRHDDGAIAILGRQADRQRISAVDVVIRGPTSIDSEVGRDRFHWPAGESQPFTRRPTSRRRSNHAERRKDSSLARYHA
jgi:hypothetical protein